MPFPSLVRFAAVLLVSALLLSATKLCSGQLQEATCQRFGNCSLFALRTTDTAGRFAWTVATAVDITSNGYAFFIATTAKLHFSQTNGALHTSLVLREPGNADDVPVDLVMVLSNDWRSKNASNLTVIRARLADFRWPASIQPVTLALDWYDSEGRTCFALKWSSTASSQPATIVANDYSIHPTFACATMGLVDKSNTVLCPVKAPPTADCESRIGQQLFCYLYRNASHPKLMAAVLLPEYCKRNYFPFEAFAWIYPYYDWLNDALDVAFNLSSGSYYFTNNGSLHVINFQQRTPEQSQNLLAELSNGLFLQIKSGGQQGVAVRLDVGHPAATQFFLAPAHLFVNGTRNFTRFEAKKFGLDEGELLTVDALVVHANYSEASGENDIAVLKLRNLNSTGSRRNDVHAVWKGASATTNQSNAYGMTVAFNAGRLARITDAVKVECFDPPSSIFCLAQNHTCTMATLQQVRFVGPLLELVDTDSLDHVTVRVRGLPVALYIFELRWISSLIETEPSAVCHIYQNADVFYTNVSMFSPWIETALNRLQQGDQFVFI